MYPSEHRFLGLGRRRLRLRRRRHCRCRVHTILPVPESAVHLKMSEYMCIHTAPYNHTTRNKGARQPDSLFVCATRDFAGPPGLIAQQFAYCAEYSEGNLLRMCGAREILRRFSRI